MNFKSRIKYGVAITGIILGLSATSAQAGVAGSMILDITGGCFSYGSSTTDCRISNGSPDAAGAIEYAAGSFTFNNTLSGISNPSAYAYQASVSLHAEAPGTAISFDDTRSKTFATLADLQSDPLWNTAYAFVTAVLNQPTGSFTATIPTPPTPPASPGTTIEASWSYTPASATGTFEAWSSDNLNGISQLLFGQNLPTIPVNFSLNVALSAIPEPATIALIGLGILGMGAAQRRKAPAALLA